ncbi:MAG: DNA/RNA nuclease SfsA [Deferribacterales bacterium]
MYEYSKLLKGKFIKRYKRFFTDVLLEGDVLTVHNPNTGSMKCVLRDGADVLISESDNPDRKLKHTLEAVMADGRWILTNTILMNRIVRHGLLDNEVKELKDITYLKSEYKYGDGRIDFYGENPDGKFLAEVKNVTMFDDEYAIFPDAVTERGRKHLGLLLEAAKEGYRPYMIYVCQIDRPFFRPAYEIDAKYAEALEDAVEKGLNVITVLTEFDEQTGCVRLTEGGKLRFRR